MTESLSAIVEELTVNPGMGAPEARALALRIRMARDDLEEVQLPKLVPEGDYTRVVEEAVARVSNRTGNAYVSLRFMVYGQPIFGTLVAVTAQYFCGIWGLDWRAINANDLALTAGGKSISFRVVHEHRDGTVRALVTRMLAA